MHCQSSFSCHLGVDWIQHESNVFLGLMNQVGAATQTDVVLSRPLRPEYQQLALCCFLMNLRSAPLFPHEHQNTSQATKADSFFSHGEWRDVSFTELPTWQYVFQLSKSCSCGPKPPLKRRDVHWCVPYLFFVHAKCFCSTIVSVHLGRALPVHDMK